MASAHAQFVTTSTTAINFGNVTTGDTMWQTFTIKPLSGLDVQIESAYQSDSTFLFDLNQFPVYINAGDSMTFNVGFHTDQNIQSNSELGFKMFIVTTPQSFSIDLKGTGVYPETYYSTTQNLSEEALKTALQTLLNNNVISLGYNMVRDSMYLKVDNQKVNGQGAAVNTLASCYTGQSAAGFSDRTDLQNNYGFNCEHTFPQSMFNGNEPMLSDMFHLYPCDASSNSTRGNLPFGTVTNATWSQGGSQLGNGVFEPRDAQKGFTSRSVLYFLMRFGNLGTFVNATQESVLKNWNHTFLPDSVEQRRNEDIYGLQHNRNPFIDHPLMVNRISSFISFSQAQVVNHYHELLSEEIWNQFDIQFYPDTIRNHIIINDGNQDIILSNFLLASTNNLLVILDSVNLIHQGESGEISILNPYGSHDYGILVFNNSAKINGLDTVYLNTFSDGIQEITSTAIQLFPSPANTQLLVVANHATSNSKIEISDLFGRILIQQTAMEGNNHIEISSLPNGIYFVFMKDQNGNHSAPQKLVVQH